MTSKNLMCGQKLSLLNGHWRRQLRGTATCGSFDLKKNHFLRSLGRCRRHFTCSTRALMQTL